MKWWKSLPCVMVWAVHIILLVNNNKKNDLDKPIEME